MNRTSRVVPASIVEFCYCVTRRKLFLFLGADDEPTTPPLHHLPSSFKSPEITETHQRRRKTRISPERRRLGLILLFFSLSFFVSSSVAVDNYSPRLLLVFFFFSSSRLADPLLSIFVSCLSDFSNAWSLFLSFCPVFLILHGFSPVIHPGPNHNPL